MKDLLQREALDYHSGGRPGKIAIKPTKPLQTQRDLSLAYTPGVAQPCLEIAEDPQQSFKYTARGNLVAVISNGTAVLGEPLIHIVLGSANKMAVTVEELQKTLERIQLLEVEVLHLQSKVHEREEHQHKTKDITENKSFTRLPTDGGKLKSMMTGSSKSARSSHWSNTTTSS